MDARQAELRLELVLEALSPGLEQEPKPEVLAERCHGTQQETGRAFYQNYGLHEDELVGPVEEWSETERHRDGWAELNDGYSLQLRLSGFQAPVSILWEGLGRAYH